MISRTQTHMLSTFLAVLLASGVSVVLAQDPTVNTTGVPLLEPFNGTTVIPIPSSTAIVDLPWIVYFASTQRIIYVTAAGFCVLWVLISGIMIMVSGDNSGMRDNAITRMKAAITGLLILLFAGPILNFMNSIFFTR